MLHHVFPPLDLASGLNKPVRVWKVFKVPPPLKFHRVKSSHSWRNTLIQLAGGKSHWEFYGIKDELSVAVTVTLASFICFLLAHLWKRAIAYKVKPNPHTDPATTSIRLQAVNILLRLSYIVRPLINIMQIRQAVELWSSQSSKTLQWISGQTLSRR